MQLMACLLTCAEVEVTFFLPALPIQSEYAVNCRSNFSRLRNLKNARRFSALSLSLANSLWKNAMNKIVKLHRAERERERCFFQKKKSIDSTIIVIK